MIKLNLTGTSSNGSRRMMLIPADNFAWVIPSNSGSKIRLRSGDTYDVTENIELIADMFDAAYRRRWP